jgi:hypothetical protein
VRERLRATLPDMPVKREGHDEERFLFAQLVAASERVTLSWPRANEDGRECARSSFVERLLRGGDANRSTTPGVATLHERALRAGLAGARKGFGRVLPLILRESAPPVRGCAPEELARVRTSVIAEHELGGGPRTELGPYFGFVGAIRDAADPRSRPLHVTALEGFARCGWKMFLERQLKIAPPLDGDDALPGSDTRMLGLVVHGVIEEIFRGALESAQGVAAAWPDDPALIELATAKARELLAKEFVPLPELARVLARQALLYLRRARALDAADGARLRVLGVESQRVAHVPDADGKLRELHFRVDRVERIDGLERLTDYKTGKPISDAVGAEKRASKFVRAIASGKTLQPVAYAFAAEAGGSGRLLYLDPELDAEAASFEAHGDAPEIAQAFGGALGALFAAWHTGSFYPRLLDEKLEGEGDACRSCDVWQACIQNDSTAKRRLARWVGERTNANGSHLAAAERGFLAAFRLGGEPPKPRGKKAET